MSLKSIIIHYESSIEMWVVNSVDFIKCDSKRLTYYYYVPYLFVRVLVLGVGVGGDEPLTVAPLKHDHTRRFHARFPFRVEEQVLRMPKGEKCRASQCSVLPPRLSSL